MMSMRIPASLKYTVPLILLVFVAALVSVNLLYHVPKAEQEAEEESQKRLAQEMSRLQSTIEYLLLKGDAAAAQHEISVLAHNHDVVFAALTDENGEIVTATRRASLGRKIADVLPQFDLEGADATIHERRAGMAVDSNGNEMLGHAGILLPGDREALRPSKTGGVFLIYDLKRYKAEARAQVVQQSYYWAGWVTALAAGLWLTFHFLLTRRSARLVHAAEEIAAGNLGARSDLRGTDELGRLGRAFDSMAFKVAETQRRLRADIAERERVQQALAASEASYRAIFDASEDAIFLHDIDTGAIIDVNSKACAVFGYSREEFRTIDVGALGTGVHPYTQDEAVRLMALAAAGEHPCIEWHGRSKSGELRWHEVFVKRVKIGGVDRILALAHDITERKRAAEELARQREALYQREKLAALGSLLAGVAHELNNPLSVVVARAVLLEEQDDPATRTAALKIRTAAERCARIVRTFLAMARQQRPERGAVAMNDVVSAALDIASYAVRTSNIDVALDLAPDVPPVLADADQLHQVLLNLIINAQQSLQEQALPRRIRIVSRFDRKTNTVSVAVADNGPGIPPHIRARVFEPYFTTKPQGIGTGVGLAVSLGIMEAHGGTLTAESPPGGGATFTMTLPAGDVDASAAQAAPVSWVGGLGRTVLIVDDEPEIRDALADILESARHRVETAASGREALERMAATHYDVILTDIRMPDLDGRALYEAIERRWPGRAARVVFVTGDTLATSLREFVNASGRPVIEKPFAPSDVRRIVAETAAGLRTREPQPGDARRRPTQTKQE
jgi:two-component system NtrC family sensor kinase